MMRFFRRHAAQPIAPEWMFVGLGNPGPEYRGTRHNVGFDLIDLVAEGQRIKLDTAKHKARYGLGTIEGHGVLLVKPMTFMNLSGQAVAPLARHYGLSPVQIVVIADELDLPPGKLKMQPRGGAGGHNGHKSVIASLGGQDYPRLRIGVGRGSGGNGAIEHVLSTFTPDERPLIDGAVKKAHDALLVLVNEGLERALTFANNP